jgi:Signal recognition particle GTPase
MSYAREHGGSGVSRQSTSLVLPPLAPKIAALAEQDPRWGQTSRLEQWRRWLGKTDTSDTSENLKKVTPAGQAEVREAVSPVEPAVGNEAASAPSVIEARESVPAPELEIPQHRPSVAETAVVEEKPETITELPAADSGEAESITAEPVEAVVEPVEPPPEVTAPAPVEEIPEDVAPAPRESGFSRIRRALSRTGQGFEQVFLGQKKIDDELLEDLETQLLTADLGMEVTTEVIDNLTDSVQRKELSDVTRLQQVLRQQLVDILKPCEAPLRVDGQKPFVLLTVGVNGVGKTTTIGKLAKKFLGDDHSVMLAAGDTFRAAAVEQLQTWGERNEVPVIAQHTGADSASVIFDALESAKARKTDVLIADTAGRLHTKDNLMEELKKNQAGDGQAG